MRQVGDIRCVFLRRAVEVLEAWKSSKRTGFTNETFLANICTLKALVSLAEYLISERGFTFVMLGKFQSDPLEGRFGWYRQLNGGNFFMSLRQVLDAEKRIRVLSLMKQRLVCGVLAEDSTKPESEASTESLDLQNHDKSIADQLIDTMQCADVQLLDEDINHEDGNVLFYIAGCFGRGVSRRRKCDSCKEMLVSSTSSELPKPELCAYRYHELMDMADRGGLSSPTELCFAICKMAFVLIGFFTGNSQLHALFMRARNHQLVFLYVLRTLCGNNDVYKLLLEVRCNTHSHSAFDSIVKKFFNCYAKNELKRANTIQISDVTACKISKLQSTSSKK